MKRLLQTLTVTLGLCCSVHAQDFLTNGLVAYFPFNGNAKDESGHAMDGIVYGAMLTPDRFGINNSAYYFNGTAYIETINELPDMPSATVSCWINAPVFSHNYAYLLMDGGTTAGRDFCFDVDGITGGKTNVVIYTKDSEYALGSFPLLTNTWLHFVGVADNQAQVLKIWVNGHLTGTARATGYANVGFHSPLSIGCRAMYYDYNFKGSIDDLRIYNRALSDFEVQQLFFYESIARPALRIALYSGYPGLTINGVVGLSYGIQYTTDLRMPHSWQGLDNVTLSVPRQTWYDPQLATQPQRYYRLVPGPTSIP